LLSIPADMSFLPPDLLAPWPADARDPFFNVNTNEQLAEANPHPC
jgi:hypothetical protein